MRSDDPSRVGSYRLLRRLGGGGMGQVYLGRTAGGRNVAIKMVRGEYAADHQFRLRFRREVTAARQVSGPWTVPVLAADTEGPRPWVATGFVPGPSLSSAVREFGPLPEPTVLALGVGLCEALSAIHRLGLVHRDVKPSNVLLALDGPRLIDFGIARVLDGTAELTRSGLILGSPGYMSPEQAQGREAGAPTDVFSLGAVLAYAATGTAPFGDGVSAATLLYRVIHEEPDLADLRGDLRELVSDCLAKDPARRPAPGDVRRRLLALDGGTAHLGSENWLPPAISDSVGRLAVELLDLDDASTEPPVRPPTAPALGPPAAPVPPPASPPRRTPWPLPALGAFVAFGALALAGTGLWLSRHPDTSPPSPSQTVGTTAPATGAPSSTPAAPAASDVPGRFLGAWTDYLASPQLPGVRLYFRISIRPGRIGAVVASIRNQISATGYCNGTAALQSAAPDRLVLQTSSISGLGCIAETAPQTYTPASAASLHLEVNGMAGDLHKSGS
ncbi:protein kinase domain-containing protein [Actinomadura formosensis]|uniref:serine/threonine-protein kinase n=1 Tax=Actinomadura formosensis TaxID=60706 RepID=UPI003D8E384E